MSEKKDERDIDEILASLDAMLAESQASSSTTDTRKEVVDQATRDSEDQLAITSSADDNETPTSTLQPFEPLDEGGNDDSKTSPETDIQEEADVEDAPRPRIMLTEENLEPAAQESLPLWAEHGQTNNDEPEDIAQEEHVDATTIEPETSTASEDDAIEGVSGENESDNEGLADELSDLSELDDINLPEISENDDSSTLSDESENISETDEETNNIEDVVAAEYEHEPANTAEANVEQSSEAADFEAKDSDNDAKSDAKIDEFDAVFDAIANDDTITFDISEAMDEDTLYDIQVLDNELVEAFVQNVVHEHDEEQPEKEELEETEVKEESADATNDVLNIEDQAATDEETSNHDVEADVFSDEALKETPLEDDAIGGEVEPLAAHIETSVQDAIEQDETITLNPDELDPIIEAISDDVRIKINQHLQQILPELISEALLEHLANQRDNSDD